MRHIYLTGILVLARSCLAVSATILFSNSSPDLHSRPRSILVLKAFETCRCYLFAVKHQVANLLVYARACDVARLADGHLVAGS
jgi:hypothetical protein